MKKNSFTLLELIIVMTILAAMFLMTRNLFRSDNNMYYQGEICINNYFFELKDVSNAALLSRSRNLSGIYFASGNVLNPDRYGFVFRPASQRTPQRLVDVESPLVSGFIRTIYSNPTPSTIVNLGTLNGQSISLFNLLSTTFFFRGTGSVTKSIYVNNDNFNVGYFPIGGPNLKMITGWNANKGCVSRDYFVNFTIPSGYPNETALRVGFQTSSATDDAKKMIIYHTQRLSGGFVEAQTGSLNLQICNRSNNCKETHRIFFDSRVNDIFLQRCSAYNASLKCTNRQGGNIN